jgi:hypothetical protein
MAVFGARSGRKTYTMKLGEGSISNLVEIAFETGLSSSPLINFFNSYGCDFEVVSMLESKRKFANQAWRKINQSKHLAEAINQILSPHYWQDESDRQRKISMLSRTLEMDGWKLEQNGERLEFFVISKLGNDTILNKLRRHGDLTNHENLTSRIRVIENTIEESPSDAIGAAKELIEAVAKDIIEKVGKTPAKKSSPSSLVNEVFASLGIAPNDISNKARGVDAIKSTLRALSNIATQLDEIRGLYGSGHGRPSSAKGLEPRHARLAVGAAASLCVFMIESFEHFEETNDM